MSTNILRDAIILSAGCVTAVLGFMNRAEIMDWLGLEPAPAVEDVESTDRLNMAGDSDETLRGQVVSLSKSPDGHFWTHARVNRGTVKFMVDTGASIIALTPEDARKAGIRMQDLTFDRPIETAGGRIYAASITLDRVSVGAIILDDVDAVVVKEGLTTSLLGMSFLGRLQKVEANQRTMILRR